MRPTGTVRARIAAVAAALCLAAASLAQPVAKTTVGLEGKVLWRYSGAAVRPVPADDRAKVAVRIADRAEDAGATIYDLRFIAQRTGEYDLRSFLEHIDGTPVTDGPAMPVAVGAILPEDAGSDLFDIASRPPPRLGGYRTFLIAAGVLWAVPLVYVIARRALRRRPAPPSPPARPPTLADQLRPLVEAAMAGTLSVQGRARLEMLLLAYWRERLDLRGIPHADAIARLKAHAEAGALVRRLEAWLHRPAAPQDEPVDVAVLLRPYRDAAPVELEPVLAGGAA
jgi:hypothetical protein